MEERPSRVDLKRPLPDDNDDSSKPPAQKRVRFPKGKKVKPGSEKVDVWQPSADGTSERADPRHAAKERALRRNQIIAEPSTAAAKKEKSEDGTSERTDRRLAAKERAMWRYQLNAELFVDENRGMARDISAAEVHYEDGDTFVDDGIQIEPFNLEKEREEGYFDEQGNFVEYVNENEIKDAWLDSIEFDPKLAEKGPMMMSTEEDIHELSSQDVGKMKRRIADVLEPGETVLQALRRLKGTSNNKKEKMSSETKLLFDQLTEDAMKLMENGDYNVYDEKQEVFEREAEGYERVARVRGEGTSMDVANDNISNGEDALDMFAEDDDTTTTNPTSDGSNLVSGANHDRTGQPSESGDSLNDYVYDEASGYYYSSSLGYYYDPSSGLYCCAASGQW
ncbi:uncharacterized protein LOC127802328 isoform X2 [Diospyros lotus]|nr:uncharacterized protein LOC127802328 isoform X2 [Diospyros lotus]